MRILLITLFLFASNGFAEENLNTKLTNRSKNSSKKMPAKIKQEFARALKELKDSGIEKSAIKEGTNSPDFKLAGISFRQFYTKKPVILKFYRGSWCPYCQLEMKEYEKFKTRFESKGYQIIVLTPDTKKEIRKFKEKQGVSIPIYSDKDNSIAKKFGIAFKLDKKVSKIYKKFGINLQKSQNNSLNELPLPGTYVINKDGKITFAFINADYTSRQDPGELLRSLKRN